MNKIQKLIFIKFLYVLTLKVKKTSRLFQQSQPCELWLKKNPNTLQLKNSPSAKLRLLALRSAFVPFFRRITTSCFIFNSSLYFIYSCIHATYIFLLFSLCCVLVRLWDQNITRGCFRLTVTWRRKRRKEEDLWSENVLHCFWILWIEWTTVPVLIIVILNI